MKRVGMALALLILSSAARAQSHPTDRETTTPQQDVLVRAQDPDQGLVEFDCSKCLAMTNLIFIAARDSCGNSGCDYFIFRKTQDKAFEYITTVFMNSGFQFLETKHHGMNDMLSCFHINAGECALVRSEFDGNRYQERTRETIDSSELSTRMPQRENVTPIYLNKDLKPTTP